MNYLEAFGVILYIFIIGGTALVTGWLMSEESWWALATLLLLAILVAIPLGDALGS
jgi:hypothetical protein